MNKHFIPLIPITLVSYKYSINNCIYFKFKDVNYNYIYKMSFIGEEDVDRATNLIENLKDRSLLQNGENTDSGNVENKVTKFNHASFNSNKSNKSTIIGEVSYRWVIFTCFFCYHLIMD